MNKAAQQLGKLGGNATKEKHGVEHFKRIAKGWPKGKPRKPITPGYCSPCLGLDDARSDCLK